MAKKISRQRALCDSIDLSDSQAIAYDHEQEYIINEFAFLGKCAGSDWFFVDLDIPRTADILRKVSFTQDNKQEMKHRLIVNEIEYEMEDFDLPIISLQYSDARWRVFFKEIFHTLSLKQTEIFVNAKNRSMLVSKIIMSGPIVCENGGMWK